ncbi:MAG: glycosyltransferase family 2 protein [Gaiella sp.]
MPTRFTVAIPTHDRRETAVLAASSALRQSRSPEHVVVLCDGCTDGTAEAIRALDDPRVAVLELPKGPGYAYAHRDRALDVAGDGVVVWCGDDDLLLPDHLERLGRLWDTGLFDLVTSPAALVQPDDELYWVGADWSVPEHRARLRRRNTNVMASVSVRAALVRAVGGWNGSLARRADWDLWLRVLDQGARPADTAVATVLHFQGTNREQAWSERIAQNARWLERVSQPDGRAALRLELERVRARREARLADRIEELEEAHAAIARSIWWRLGRRLGAVPR